MFSVSSGFFFLPHKTLRSRADHRLDRGARVSPGSVLFASISEFGWEGLGGLVGLEGSVSQYVLVSSLVAQESRNVQRFTKYALETQLLLCPKSRHRNHSVGSRST